jgi:hypothetical protein
MNKSAIREAKVELHFLNQERSRVAVVCCADVNPISGDSHILPRGFICAPLSCAVTTAERSQTRDRQAREQETWRALA